MIGIIQILTVEEQQRYDTATDCRIGKVENRAEEDEMVSTYERHPRRPVCFDNREIEHIDHFTVEQRSVSAAFGHKGCQLRIGAFIKQHSVEYAVDDIAQRTRQDERDTDNKPVFIPCFMNLYRNQPITPTATIRNEVRTISRISPNRKPYRCFR